MTMPAATSSQAAPPVALACGPVAIDGRARTRWDDFVQGHRLGSVFHTSAWHDVVRETFGHAPHYLQATRGRTMAGVLPLFLVKSKLAGRLLVSVPYGVAGGVLADDQDAAEALIAAAKALVHKAGASMLDLRSREAVSPELVDVARYANFERELPDGPGDVLAWLPRKARAAARNGRDKYELTVSWDVNDLPEVWRLYSINMRRIGSLAYPIEFLRRIVAHERLDAWVSLIRWRGEPAAGLLTLCHTDRVMPYFFGATDAARRCSAANFAYMTLMRRAIEHGYRVFDFGRSRVDNRGSYEFKRLHGFEPTPLRYQCFVPEGRHAPNLSPSNPKFRLARRLWPRLPLKLTQYLGARIARHVPG